MQWLRSSREDILLERPTSDVLYLFSAPAYQSLADQMLKSELGSKFMKKGEVEWKEFEDGFPNLFIRQVDQIRGRDVVFLADFLDQSSMLAQLSVIYSLPRYLAKSLIIALPYFPTGTMERVDHEGQIATAHTLARILSATPLSTGGPAKLIIYDIHALQERFYFSDTVIPLLVTAVPLIKLKLEQMQASGEQVTIAFPDDGAMKRFGNDFKKWPLVVCNKVRTKDNERIVTIKEGDVTGMHVVIIDDLVKTGGTLVQCKNALFAAGAATVSAYVTHGVFPQDSWKRFVYDEAPGKDEAKPFANFFITDSCPAMANLLANKKPFQILPLADHLSLTLLKY